MADCKDDFGSFRDNLRGGTSFFCWVCQRLFQELRPRRMPVVVVRGKARVFNRDVLHHPSVIALRNSAERGCALCQVLLQGLQHHRFFHIELAQAEAQALEEEENLGEAGHQTGVRTEEVKRSDRTSGSAMQRDTGNISRHNHNTGQIVITLSTSRSPNHENWSVSISGNVANSWMNSLYSTGLFINSGLLDSQ